MRFSDTVEWRTASEVYDVLKVTSPYFSLPSEVEEAKGTLRALSIECDRIISGLNSLVGFLPPEERDILNQYRLEILEVTKKLDVSHEKI
jgi:hypothetical protein